MIKHDLLFEIGTEEIPARFMLWALAELEGMAKKDLEELRLAYGELKVTGTPRRIVLYVKDLVDRQDDFEETVKGPPKTQALDESGNYTKAARGFAVSRGVSEDALKFEEIRGVEYLFATVREMGRETSELLPGFLEGLLKKLVFPKNMYWDNSGVRFARPVRWLVALWDDMLIPVSFGRVISGYTSRGHRFMGSGQVSVTMPEQYESIMEREHVIVDSARRERMIMDGIAELERELGGRVERDDELLAENAQLVEYPIPFVGSFEESFLDIPEEVLIATMKKNQRYFPVRDGAGKLMARFVGVSNNKARDMNVVRDGNERVLRARLRDAEFFWKEDRQRTLESRIDELKKVLYQKKLGTVYDKCQRVEKLADFLTDELGEGALKKSVARAAVLAKADLVTSMVFEFPEVQGVMGREYAKLEGETSEVADALYEQYLPRFAGDDLPAGKVGAIVGIGDRVDTITGIHKAGLPPTGSQDPYALRRAARSINEIIWGLGFDVNVGRLFDKAAELLDADDGVMDKVREFYRQRLHNQLRERGYSHGTVSLAVGSMWSRPQQALHMLEAFEEVCTAEWFASLVTSAVRVGNILAKADGAELEGLAVDSSKFREAAESELESVLGKQSAAVREAVTGCDWKAVCRALAELSPAISGFFDKVMVMDDDASVRRNRLALLVECRGLFDAIGDFSLLK